MDHYSPILEKNKDFPNKKPLSTSSKRFSESTICIKNKSSTETSNPRTYYSTKKETLKFVISDSVLKFLTNKKETHSVERSTTWPLKWSKIKLMMKNWISGL